MHPPFYFRQLVFYLLSQISHHQPRVYNNSNELAKPRWNSSISTELLWALWTELGIASFPLDIAVSSFKAGTKLASKCGWSGSGSLLQVIFVTNLG